MWCRRGAQEPAPPPDQSQACTPTPVCRKGAPQEDVSLCQHCRKVIKRHKRHGGWEVLGNLGSQVSILEPELALRRWYRRHRRHKMSTLDSLQPSECLFVLSLWLGKTKMRRTSNTLGFGGFLLETIGVSFSLVRHVFSDLFSAIVFFGGNFISIFMGHEKESKLVPPKTSGQFSKGY